jgi:hypothetical protein
MNKTMLIAGCSHTAGSEIDGTQDSLYNRQNSYGNLIAKNLGLTPINISQCGSTNSAIARSVMEYISKHEEKPKFVVVGWTDSVRVEAPYYRTSNYKTMNNAIDWYDATGEHYLRISMFINSIIVEEEREKILDYQSFTIRNEEYTEINNILHIITLQSFLKLHNIPYLMVNTNYIFEKMHVTLRWYFQLIDSLRYPQFDNSAVNFYPKYKNLGYTNSLAKYGHHGADAHLDYANNLTKYIQENNLLENT